MARQYRQNVRYDEIVSDSEGEAPEQEPAVGRGGNTRLPFGLCKKYGISLPANATPRDAWDALKGKTGLSPQDFYEKLKSEKEPSANNETADGPKKQDDGKRAVEIMLTSDRMYYDKKYITEDRIRANLDAATSEMRDLTVRLFNDDGFAYRSNERQTAFYPGLNKVNLKEPNDGGGSSWYAKGETFFHETWHAIDRNYGDDDKIPMSAGYVLSTGKTVNEMIREEARDVDWAAVEVEIERDIDAYYSARGIDRQGIINHYNEMSQKSQERYSKAYSFTHNFSSAYIAKRSFEETDEYKEAVDSYNRVKDAPCEIVWKYSALSDMYAATHGKTLERIGMGHKQSYWRSGRTKIGEEIFAEVAAARAVYPDALKSIKKYLPKTVSGVEEIISKLGKGEIKGNGKQRYIP